MFKTNNKMPTTNALLLFSYISAVLAVSGAGYLLIFRPNLKSLVLGIIVLFGGMLLAAVVRMFANIGQILFDLKAESEDLKKHLEQINCDSRDINQNIHQIKNFFEQIEGHLDLKK